MFVFLICLGLLALTIFIFLGSNKLKGIPSPPAQFLLGHSAKLNTSSKILPQLLEYYKQCGGLFTISMGPMQVVIVSDYVGIQKVLHCHSDKEQANAFLKNFLKDGLVTSSGEKWSKMRKIIGGAFYVPVLKQFIDIFNSNSMILLRKMEESDGIYLDVFPLLTSYTLDIICEAAMGIKINAQLDDNSKYAKHLHEVTGAISRRFFSIVQQFRLTYPLSESFWKERRGVEYLRNFSQDILNKRREKTDGLDKRSLVNILLASQVEGRPLTDEEILEEITTFMFAGHDTVSSTLSFLFYNIAKYPDIQENIVKELHSIFSGDQNRAVTNDDLIEMKYTEMVIKETLRLYPAGPMFPRTLLEDVQIGNTTLPKGTFVIVSVFNAHRNPDVYPDPETFDPERFAAENQSEGLSQGFMPFGAGPRNCIGQKYAMMEMKTTVANVLRKFKVLPKDRHELVLHFSIVLRGEIVLKFVPREF